MNISQYVVSLEIAKKLKEKGYPQEDSLFYWCNTGSGWMVLPKLSADNYIGKRIAAPISDEILDKLPKYIGTKLNPTYAHGLEILLADRHIWYEFINELSVEDVNKLPDALASLWIKLKEGGYIEDI